MSRVTPAINERAWAVDLISEINRLVRLRSRRIRNAGGEWGVSAEGHGNMLFPDVLLFGDPSRNAVLQGWELKMPDTPVTDSALLDNAQEKCRRLGLSSFLVWNARDAVLYRVDDGGREVLRTWCCTGVRTRADVLGNKSAWVETLRSIIDDLNDFLEQGTLSCSKPLPAHLNTVIGAILKDQTGTLESQRKIAGQYYTPIPLASLLVRLAADDLNAPILDPCCGTGTIAREVLALKLHHGLSISEAVGTTWASDRYAMPLQFTTLSLTQGDAPFETLRVFQQDVIKLHTGLPVLFVDAGSGNPFSETLPEFPCIILNPPFVRFEDWMREDSAVADVQRFVRAHTGDEIDGRSDYFVSILLHLWRLLRDNGRIGVIVPNSWMGAEWGRSFRRLLRQFFVLESVVTSGAGRWFGDADVVTNLVVLRKHAQPNSPPRDQLITFAVTKLPIADWNVEHIARMTDSINQGHAANEKTVWLNQVDDSLLDQLERDGLCWTACFSDCQWLDEIRSLLVPVADLFEIHRGERRGWDKLFFPEANSGIEDEYLLPVVKSAADIRRIDAKADGIAFCCSRSIAELERRGHNGAVAWIRRFEHASNGTGKPLPDALARKGYQWYEMRPDTTADLAVSMNPGNRLFFARLHPRAFVNQRLIRFTAKSDTDVLLCHAQLCSLAGAFYLAALGFGRGLGALDLNATKLARQMRMLNPACLSKDARKRILTAFRRMKGRDILAFSDEIKRPDRLAFERAVLAVFGVSSLFPQILESVQTLHRIRGAACG